MAATIESDWRSRMRWMLVGSAALGIGLIALVAWNRTPQIGPDAGVFRSVDALFTAVTARDLARLEACAGRLREHRVAGRLPADASDALDAIMAQARSGAWESAAERLYDFMRAQQRAGAGSESSHAEKPAPRASRTPRN